jgi:hypothetical protein
MIPPPHNAPAAVAASAIVYIPHFPVWLAMVFSGIVALLLVAFTNPLKRKVSPRQFAAELEADLLGTDDKWIWDNVTSLAIADLRLERIRRELPRFDSLRREEDRDTKSAHSGPPPRRISLHLTQRCCNIPAATRREKPKQIPRSSLG